MPFIKPAAIPAAFALASLLATPAAAVDLPRSAVPGLQLVYP